MDSAHAKSRIAALRKEVAQHDELYYRKAKPEISDEAYDRLKRELADLEAKFPQQALAAGADSPTTRVGDDRAEAVTSTYRRTPARTT